MLTCSYLSMKTLLRSNSLPCSNVFLSEQQSFCACVLCFVLFSYTSNDEGGPAKATVHYTSYLQVRRLLILYLFARNAATPSSVVPSSRWLDFCTCGHAHHAFLLHTLLCLRYGSLHAKTIRLKFPSWWHGAFVNEFYLVQFTASCCLPPFVLTNCTVW